MKLTRRQSLPGVLAFVAASLLAWPALGAVNQWSQIGPFAFPFSTDSWPPPPPYEGNPAAYLGESDHAEEQLLAGSLPVPLGEPRIGPGPLA